MSISHPSNADHPAVALRGPESTHPYGVWRSQRRHPARRGGVRSALRAWLSCSIRSRTGAAELRKGSGGWSRWPRDRTAGSCPSRCPGSPGRCRPTRPPRHPWRPTGVPPEGRSARRRPSGCGRPRPACWVVASLTRGWSLDPAPDHRPPAVSGPPAASQECPPLSLPLSRPLMPPSPTSRRRSKLRSRSGPGGWLLAALMYARWTCPASGAPCSAPNCVCWSPGRSGSRFPMMPMSSIRPATLPRRTSERLSRAHRSSPSGL
jgi:hypothetical protein